MFGSLCLSYVLLWGVAACFLRRPSTAASVSKAALPLLAAVGMLI